MASYFDRFKQIWSILTGKKDIDSMQAQLDEAQGRIASMEAEVETTRETAAATEAKMKRLSRYHTDRSIAADSEIKYLRDKLGSVSRKPLRETKKGEHPTESLSRMVNAVLNYEGEGPKPVLVPEIVEKLIFQGRANLNYADYMVTANGGRKYEGPLYKRLAEACFKNANESWAKPVLTSLFQALPRDKQNQTVIDADDWSCGDAVPYIKLLDHAISMIPPNEFNLIPLVTRPERPADINPSPTMSAWLLILLKKRGVLTPENPTYKKIADSVPVYQSTDEASIKARPWYYSDKATGYVPDAIRWVSNCDGDIEKLENRNREKSQMAHDKIVSAPTPRDRKNAEALFGKELKWHSDVYHALTGKVLWPDLQESQTSRGRGKKAGRE